MQWWNSFVAWFDSETGERVLYGAIIPFAAIVVAAVVAGLIARGGIKRLLRNRDRELKAAAVAALVDAARQAAAWNSLSPHEQALADRSASSADVQLRLLPVHGGATAATWAAHEIQEFKRASATYSVAFDGPLAEFRDRLIDWQDHPRRARKVFESDLARWQEQSSAEERELQNQQDAWAAQQHADRFAAAPIVPASSPAGQQGRPSAGQSERSEVKDSAGGDVQLPPRAPATLVAERRDSDEPRGVEAPTDDPYAPPVSASTVRQRNESAPVEQ